MPLARIITRSESDSQPLAEELQARGFEVRTSPKAVPAENVDVELSLEECTSEDALIRAAAIADELAGPENHDVPVFIAPGTLGAGAPFQFNQTVPIGALPALEVEQSASVQDARINWVGEQVHGADAPQPSRADVVPEGDGRVMPHSVSDVPAIEAPALLLSPVPPVATATPSSSADLTPEPLPTLPEPRRACVADNHSVNDPFDELLCETELTPVSSVSQFPIPDAQAEPVAETFSPETVELSLEAVSPVSAMSTLQPETIRVGDLSSVSQMETQPELIAPRQTSAAAPPSEPAFVEPMMDSVSDWPIWQPLVDELSAGPAPTVAHRRSRLQNFQTVARKVALRYAKIPPEILSDDRLFRRTATLASVAAIMVLLLGLSFHRFAPLPGNLVQGSAEAAQPVPLQKTPVEKTGQTETAATAPEAVASDSSLSTKTPDLSPVVLKSTPVKAEKIRITAPVATLHPSRRTIRPQDDLIARDTVVRHNRPSSSAPPIRAEKRLPGVKYYSDLK